MRKNKQIKLIYLLGIKFLTDNNKWSNILSSYANAGLSFIYNSIALFFLVPEQWGIISGVLVFKDLVLNFNFGEAEYIRKNYHITQDWKILKMSLIIALVTIFIYYNIFYVLYANRILNFDTNTLLYLCVIFSLDYLNYIPTNVAKSIGKFNLLKITYFSIPILNILTIPLIIFLKIEGFFISKIISSLFSFLLIAYFVKEELPSKVENKIESSYTLYSFLSTSSLLQLINIVFFFINAIPRLMTPKFFNSEELGYFAYGTMLLSPFIQFFMISNDFFYRKINTENRSEHFIIQDSIIFFNRLFLIFLAYPFLQMILNHYFFPHYSRNFIYYLNILNAYFFQAITLRFVNVVIVNGKRKELLSLIFGVGIVIIIEILFYSNIFQVKYNSSEFYLYTNVILFTIVAVYYVHFVKNMFIMCSIFKYICLIFALYVIALQIESSILISICYFVFFCLNLLYTKINSIHK